MLDRRNSGGQGERKGRNMAETIKTGGLTRRSFLKTTGAVAGAAVLGGGAVAVARSAPAVADEGQSAERICSGICHGGCVGGCRFNWTVRDGYVVKSEMAPYPNEAYNRICSKGLSHAQRTYSEDRIKYPMRRVEGTERGAGEWERISWDEAIEEVSTKWKGYIRDYGLESIFFSQSSGNVSMQNAAYLNAISGAMGFSTIAQQADQAGVQTIIKMMGWQAPIVTCNEGADIANAKKLFIFGCNAALSLVQSSSHIYAAKDNGCKVYAVDPNYTPTVAKYSDYHIALRPATDAMVFMGMMQAIIEEGLQDDEFLKTKSVAPFLVKRSDGLFLRQEDLDGIEVDPSKIGPDTILVVGEDGVPALASEAANPALSGIKEVGGIKVDTVYDLMLKRLSEYPIDMCAEVSGIEADMIRQMGRDYAEGPSTVLFQFGPDHYTNGHTGYMALFALASVAGQMQKPGAGISQGGIISSMGLAGAMDWIGKVGSAAGEAGAMSDIGVMEGGVALAGCQLQEFKETGGYINGQKVGGDDFHPKSWWIAGQNPLQTTSRKSILDSLDLFELIVVEDTVWNEMAYYADIVLPVAYYTEYEDVSNGVAFSAPYIVHQEKCIEPLFEGLTDYEISTRLIDAIGYGHLTCPSYEEWLEFSFEASPVCSAQGITLEKIREVQVIKPRYPEENEDGIIIGKPATPTGRVEFLQENPVPTNPWPGEFDPETERIFYWIPPEESWVESVGGFEATEASKKYPLSFHWRRSRFATHTNFSVGCHWLDEIDTEPFIYISPSAASDRGISDGDVVRVYNDRGYCVLRAHIDGGCRPWMIYSTQRAQGSGVGDYIEGSLGDLSSNVSHPYILNANFSECQVEIEKYEEA